MVICAIITEYNPFHNGHKYQIEMARKKTGADIILCIMSGNFVQRGEAAIANAHARAQMAIMGGAEQTTTNERATKNLPCNLSGADVVIQLPTIFSCMSAQLFAYGALKILNAIPAVKYLCFGAEDDNLEHLQTIANILHTEPPQFKAHLQKLLQQGHSYPSAMRESIAKHTADSGQQSEINIQQSVSNGQQANINHASILEKPNNLLAVEYLKALKKLNSKIQPILIKRQANDKTKNNPNSPSATFIRDNIRASGLQNIISSLPPFAYKTLEQLISYGHYINLQTYNTLVMHKLLTLPTQQLADIYDINEGLENLIKKHLPISPTLNCLFNNLKSKRYSKARLNRILTQALLNITKKDVKDALSAKPYIKILAINKSKKQQIIKALTNAHTKEHTKTHTKTLTKAHTKANTASNKIYTIMQYSDYEKLPPKTKQLLTLDILANNIYNILTNQTQNYFQILEI
ncbi:MAG: nucleotidyltransferase family protein [Firmicutes bacterium]|nr:nucleotidyltransferase family protein [Bacillota bacterium]